MSSRKTNLFLLVTLLCLPMLTNSTTIANCAAMSPSGATCSSCKPGYETTDNGVSCTAIDCSAMTNCALCDTTTTCLNCDFGY